MIKFQVVPIGAAKIVTGSSFWVKVLEDDIPVVQFIVDHGLFQGPDVEEHNYDEYPFKPEEINFVFVTHAHADHSARLPMLVKRGFSGAIYLTEKTAQLTELILRDSAKIQSNNEERFGKISLYNQNDVEQTLSLFKRVVSDQTIFLPNINNFQVSFLRVGHILGACSLVINFRGKVISFSGDVGRPSYEFIKSFSETEKLQTDYIFMESLYGGKLHPDKNQLEQDFVQAVNKILNRNGNVIIPAFAIHRTQQMLLLLKQSIDKGLIRDNVQIYLDSSLGNLVTGIYTESVSEMKESEFFSQTSVKSSMYYENVNVVKGRKGYQKVLKKGRSIIIAGSGMCNGGKILNYLKKCLPYEANGIIIVGFQAEGTLGRDLLSGSKQVAIDNEQFPVKAEIIYLPGFSAHGDQSDLLRWLVRFEQSRLKKVFLIHSELEQSEPFARKLQELGYNYAIPAIGEVLILE